MREPFRGRIMKDYLTIKELPKEERPYEKFEELGAESLTDAELLAIIIRTGARGRRSLDLARDVLNAAKGQGLLGICKLRTDELMKIRGIGNVKAIQLKCVAELSRRIAKSQAGKRATFEDPSVIAGYYMEDMRYLKQEEMRLVMLNTKNELLGERTVSKGTVNASLITPRELFLEALHVEAVFIVLLHNHPSGDPIPSRADLRLTKRIQEAGRLIGIRLLDHIVIGDNCYFSMKGHGIL